MQEQNYPHIEHIVIDAGSTDGTLEYLQSVDTRIDHLISEPDKGIADAFNKGIKAANGDYILLLNADDYLEPGVFRILEEFIKRESTPDIIFGTIRYLDGTMEYTEKPNLNRIWDYMSIFHPATLVRRECYDRIGMFSSDYTLAMDCEWFHRAVAANTRFAEFPGIIATMRTGGRSHQGLWAALGEFRRSAQKHGGSQLRPWFFQVRQYLAHKLLKIRMVKRLNLARRHAT